jgi:2-hydroxyglutarate dehydrogenase
MTSPDPPTESDVVVVGAGILGLAIARDLHMRRPELTITVLEKENEVGFHQTSHNSGVIHAGIYYRPDSLKARLCVEGARAMFDFCDEHDIAVERCGKLIVALGPEELERLDELERRGHANAVPGLRRVGADQLREIEPYAAGIAALHSPGTGIVDFPAVARAMATQLRADGIEVSTGCEVGSAIPNARRLKIAHSRGVTETRFAVFCAGAWSDRLAVRCGAAPDPRIVPFRGAYLKLRENRRHLVRGLIYPVPDPGLPFLGVHLTRHISGEVLVGPTALMAPARDAYRLLRARPRDLASTATWPGTWRVARRWWRTAGVELLHASSRAAFTRAAARYVPGLTRKDVEPAFAGVRAQAVGRDGGLVDDFVFSHTERALHVRNAPSPAATAALAIARTVVDDVGRHASLD